MTKTLAIINLIVTLGTVSFNYVAGSIGLFGNTVGSLSDEYDNLFTPADYAFTIWGLIFIALIAHAVFQVSRAFSDKNSDFIGQIGPWLIIANLLNMLWLYLWLSEHTGATVFVMLALLISLLVIVLRLNMERWDAPNPIIFWVWWPISLYSGWIAVATIANISAYLAKTGWSEWFSESTWTIVMISAATFINVLMILRRNMREFAGVGIWALIAIASRHWETNQDIKWTALTGSALLFFLIVWQAGKNWKTLPFVRRNHPG